MNDIQTKQDIELLVDEFYKKVVIDTIIGPFFTEVIPITWDVHIPIMISFWETLLLGKQSYKGNPMLKHIELNKLSAMEPRHFERWILLWEKTINEHFSGPKSDEAVMRAKAISGIMQSKISMH